MRAAFAKVTAGAVAGASLDAGRLFDGGTSPDGGAMPEPNGSCGCGQAPAGACLLALLLLRRRTRR